MKKSRKTQWHYRDRVYSCGDYMPVDIFPVFDKPGQRRKKAKPTSDIQAKLNVRHSSGQYFRKLHANFAQYEDLKVDLTFDQEHLPASPEEGKASFGRFVDRLRYRWKKKGIDKPLKYMVVMGEGRIHFHTVLTGGLTWVEIKTAWGNGGVNVVPLQFDEFGPEAMVGYFLRQARGTKKWWGSRNLINPEPSERDWHLTKSEVKELADRETVIQAVEAAYPGYEFVDGDVYRNKINAGAYVHLLLRKKRPKVARRRSA